MNQTRSRDDHLVRSYLSLRKSIGIIGIGLPFALALGGLLLMGTALQKSISHYYHTGLRDVFVGSLCAVAVFFWSYRGYERRDNIAGNIACIFALGVALFPTTPGPEATTLQLVLGRLHVIFAAGFFGTLAYFSLVLFRLSDQETPTGQKMVRNVVYEVCGYSIIICIIAIGIVSIPPVASVLSLYKPVFWFEAGAVVAFGASWFTKGEAILKDRGPQPATRQVAPRIPRHF